VTGTHKTLLHVYN